LQLLYCSNCPLLTNIPHIDGLQELACYNCRSLTKLNINVANLDYSDTYGCIWLDNDPNYDQSIKKLILLQKWWKKIYLSNRLKKLIKQLIPLYYHPDAKGGYFDKLKIFQCFQEISEQKN
jgi:hypothetical protein